MSLTGFAFIPLWRLLETFQDWECSSLLSCIERMVQDITLAEALCGTSFTIKHLDDRILKVASAPGEVIKPDSWKCIADEGMPEHGRPYEHGNLYIQFHVKFPESLNKQQVSSLQQTLGGIMPSLSNGETNMDIDNVEEVTTLPALLFQLE